MKFNNSTEVSDVFELIFKGILFVLWEMIFKSNDEQLLEFRALKFLVNGRLLLLSLKTLQK